MNFNRVVIFALLSCVFVILSCSDENMPLTCTLSNLRSTSGDSIVYSFDDAKKLKKIVSYVIKKQWEVIDLEYDASGQLKKVIKKWAYPTENIYAIHELTYDNTGKPKSLNSWGADTSYPPITTTFAHDSKGRLIKKEKISSSTRYEYNDQDNVANIFYASPSQPEEELGRENLSFDNTERFFASIPDYANLNIYINGLEPSKNNVLTAMVTKENALSKYFEPVEVSYDAFYDESGLISSYYRHSDPGQTSEEFLFQKAIYDCK